MSRRIVTAVSAALLVLIPAVAAAEPAQAAASPSAARACAAWRVVPSHAPAGSGLNAVAATSARNAWAVGTRDVGGAYKSLIERWNGSAWKVVASPNLASGYHTTNALGAVVALSAKNAWAFGFYEKKSTTFRTLIEHWNGSRWSVVTSPNSGTGENTLGAAVALSASDIWAVGYRNNPGHRRTLTEHYDGSTWKIVASPSVGSGDSFLFGDAVDPAGTVWAVGTDPVSYSQTLAMTRTPAGWSVTHTANPGDGDRFLQAVAAPAAGRALAVGSYLKGSGGRTLAERWTGSAWVVVPSASPARSYNSLQGIAASSISSAWAVGSRQSGPGVRFTTLTEHWNGSRFAVVASPSPGRGDDWLYGIAAVPRGGGYWAVGNAGSGALTEFRC
jgi:hypothetical protein